MLPTIITSDQKNKAADIHFKRHLKEPFKGLQYNSTNIPLLNDHRWKSRSKLFDGTDLHDEIIISNKTKYFNNFRCLFSIVLQTSSNFIHHGLHCLILFLQIPYLWFFWSRKFDSRFCKTVTAHISRWRPHVKVVLLLRKGWTLGYQRS